MVQQDATIHTSSADSQPKLAPLPDTASEFERLQQLLLKYEQSYERGTPEVS